MTNFAPWLKAMAKSGQRPTPTHSDETKTNNDNITTNTTIIMKTLLLAALMAASSTAALAQDRVKSISLEGFGAQNTVGINYDTRFKGNSGWGYRVGVGYGCGNNSNFFDQDVKGVGVPLEINYLLGKRHSKLEMGVGTNLGIYHVKESAWEQEGGATATSDTPDDPSAPSYAWHETSSNRFGYLVFVNVGYRHERQNGLMYRLGISPSFNFGDSHGLKKTFFYPYVGLGWAF